MTVARVSQAVVEVLRANTAVKAQVSQVAVEVLRIKLPAALASQVVAEVITAERTLSASFNCGLAMQADLVPGLYLGATFTASLAFDSGLELGSEFSAAGLPVSVEMQASLQAEARFAATLPVSMMMQPQLQKGYELASTLPVTINQRAGLKVYPESVTGFFLLF